MKSQLQALSKHSPLLLHCSHDHEAGSDAGHWGGHCEERMSEVQFPLGPVTGKAILEYSGDLKRGWTEDIDVGM